MLVFLYFIILTVYPLYQTMETIRVPRIKTCQHWLIYWTIYAQLCILDSLLWWFPLFSTLRFIILFICQATIITQCLRKYYILALLRDIKKYMRNVPEIKMPSNIIEILKYDRMD